MENKNGSYLLLHCDCCYFKGNFSLNNFWSIIRNAIKNRRKDSTPVLKKYEQLIPAFSTQHSYSLLRQRSC